MDRLQRLEQKKDSIQILISSNVEFFIIFEKTLSANLQFAADGCAQTSFELVWVAMQP